MSDRPTPEQIAMSPDDIVYLAKTTVLSDLKFYGYVIVHPDDAVPVNRIHLDTDSNRTFAHIVVAAEQETP